MVQHSLLKTYRLFIDASSVMVRTINSKITGTIYIDFVFIMSAFPNFARSMVHFVA